jgi:hypothetical protein
MLSLELRSGQVMHAPAGMPGWSARLFHNARTAVGGSLPSAISVHYGGYFADHYDLALLPMGNTSLQPS